MAQGTTFSGRVYLGSNTTTSPSIRAVTGVPSFVLGDNAGDQVLSDNGQIYACDGTSWSPVVNANGTTTMTANLSVLLPALGPAVSASATGSTISTSTATNAYSVTDTAGGGVVARIDTGSGAARITAEDTTTPTPISIPLNLAIRALQVNGSAGISGQVLTSAGAGLAPTWVTPAAAGSGGGILYYLNQNTAPQAPTTNIPVPGTTTTKQLGTAADTPATSVTSGTLTQVGYDLIANFVTDVGTPSVTAIPAGIWAFNVWASSNAGQANQTILQIQVGKYDGSNTPTIIATSNDVSIYDPTVTAVYTISVLIPGGTTLLSTDRLYVAIRAKATQNNRTITLSFGDGNPTNVVSTIPSKAGGDLSGTYPNPAVIGMGGTSTKTLYVIEGGQYATLQAAVDAASTGTMILVGPKTTGDWGNVSMTTANRNLIIAAISGAGPNKVVKVGSITYNPLGASDLNLNEVYLYGLFIQGSFAGGSALTFSGTGAARLRVYGCYILNSSATGTSTITNSNTYTAGPSGPSSSLYLDDCTIAMENSTTGTTLVHSGSYTLVRNRSEISAVNNSGATGYAISVTTGLLEVISASVSLEARTTPQAAVNITGSTTILTLGYSTITNSSNAAGSSCVYVGTSGAIFGAGDATLVAGSSLASAAYAVNGVAGGVYAYANVSMAYGTTVNAVTATATAQSGGLYTYGMSVGTLVGGTTYSVSSTGNITKINNVTTSFPSVQGSNLTRLQNNGSGTLTWAIGNQYGFGASISGIIPSGSITNAIHPVTAPLTLPNLTAAQDGLVLTLVNGTGSPGSTVQVTPTSGTPVAARTMTQGGGQTWVWRNASGWWCVSNV